MPHHQSPQLSQYLQVTADLPSAQLLKTTEASVHVLASGNSIKQVNIEVVRLQPTIFVNGSIQLFADYEFAKPSAYVISDYRFIEHNANLMKQYYHGQFPLYITQSVLEKLQRLEPDYLTGITQYIHLIYNFQKPFNENKSSIFSKIKKKLGKPQVNNEFIKLKPNTAKPLIGVSTDIHYGFVEAGTVVFVATQLAYSLGFQHIYIHGMDLLNTDQPRFYEKSENKAPIKLAQAIENRIIPSFDFLAETYQQAGVMVYNGSPVSKEIFKQMAFTDAYLK